MNKDNTAIGAHTTAGPAGIALGGPDPWHGLIYGDGRTERCIGEGTGTSHRCRYTLNPEDR